MQRRPFFARYGFAILVVVAAVTPLLLDAAIQAVRSNRNNVQDWLPASFVETGDLAWFRRHFAGDQFVVISWDGCRISGKAGAAGAAEDDPRIEQLAELLVPTSGATATTDGSPADAAADATKKTDGQDETPQYFKSVMTARRLLDQMTASGVPFNVASRRLQGSLLGKDLRQTCLVAMLSNDSINHFREILGRGTTGRLRMQRPPGVLFEKLKTCGVDPTSVHLGGPPVDNVSIDEEGERTLIRLAGLAGLLGLGLSWWSLRSIPLTLIVYSCGILSAILGLAAVKITGQSTDAILLSMPALVYILAISGAIHLINHYREALAEGNPAEAAGKALSHGWKPALFCNITTAFGLLSLFGSDLVPISKFGTYSALAVMLMLAVLFLYLPAALQYWRPRVAVKDHSNVELAREQHANVGPPAPERHGHARHDPAHAATAVAQKPRFDIWEWLGSTIIRHHRLVATTCMLVIIGVGWGITRIHTTIDLLKLFDQHARIIQDYRWLEANVGQLVPMEIAVQFPPQVCARMSIDTPKGASTSEPGKMTFLDRLDFISQLQVKIERQLGRAGKDLVGPSMSAVTFVPPLPVQRRGMLAITHRKTLNSQLEQSFDSLLHSGYLTIDQDKGNEVWRISLRVAAFKGVDYGQFSDELRQLVDPLIQQQNTQRAVAATAPAITATYTGVVPIVYKAQRALLESLVQSTVWSFVTIAPLLMFVSRGVRSGLVAMLPNVLPIVMVFGGMGWLNCAVDIGSMMSASIALGVAVDDTIHYLTWFREDLKVSGDRHAAILAAYRTCALPTLQASLINGLGLSVFALSTFTPTKQFGFLMLTILIAGVVAELILLPSLLAGPLGAVFGPLASPVSPSPSPVGGAPNSVPLPTLNFDRGEGRARETVTES